MKKIVPDPPHLLIQTPYFSVHSDISSEDAITHGAELIRGVAETIDEHCRLHAGEPGLNTLANAAFAAESALILFQHALASMSDEEGQAHE
ncbi:hypothetical protein [Pseudomonas fluorescens]|jgi:hypothetical protein|uniref:hypothetical protein n=1 Tax=Pseudomonas fluorescens TaxID=294 RepID=UPI0020C1FDC6|nr:hypothetical protein [Pseudomonas fluorescens]UTL90830.1 hypothetical protein NLL86_25940 [Pseudomonas fluorescens]